METFDIRLTTKREVLPAVLRVRRLIKSWKPDVLVCRGQFAGFTGALATLFVRSVRIVYVCAYPSFYADGGLIRNARNWLVEFVSCRCAETVVVLNVADSLIYRRRRLASMGTMTIIPNGVDTERFVPQPKEDEHRRIGFVGRMVEWKGVDVLIKAVEQLPSQLRDGLRVDLIGDGVALRDIKKLAEAATMRMGENAPTFTFHGPTTADSAFYSNCTFVVVPSRAEAFGIVALEAMSCGRPVIASNVGGLAESVRSEVTGLLVEPGDSDLLSGAISLLLADPDRTERLASQARQHVIDNFGRETMNRRYGEIYGGNNGLQNGGD